MVKPTIAVDIIARDKSAAGMKAAERAASGFSRRTSALSKELGLSKIGQQVASLTKIRDLTSSFNVAGRSLSNIGHLSMVVANDMNRMTGGFALAGAGARGAFGAVAAGAGVATTAVLGLGAAVAAIGIGTYKFGEKWAKIGASVGRSAQDLGVSNADLQARRAAAERYGVAPDQVDASIEGLGSTLYDAKYGANNLALGALNQLGVKLKTGANGQTDIGAAMDDISDAIARQKDPMVQRKLASIFGISGMLPALRQGSATLKADGADFMGSGAAFSDAEVAKSTAAARKAVVLEQHLRAIEKTAGVAAAGATGAMADTGLAALRSGGSTADRASTSIREGAHSLARSGVDAGRSLVEGGRRAAAALEASGMRSGHGPTQAGFEAFQRRIEHQESRGRQFDRSGRPLTSSRGAVGVMQVLPETARRAAARARIPFDERRFRNDPAYNRMIGSLELRRLYDKYDGNEVLAASAYNAGEGRLDGYYDRKKKRRYVGWLERFGDPRKGEISDAAFQSRIPFAETKDYAAKTAATSKTQVEITLRGAPQGTVARVTGGQGSQVAMNVVRSMDAP